MKRIWIGLTIVLATAASAVIAQQPGTSAAPVRSDPSGSADAVSKPRTVSRSPAPPRPETLPVLKAGTPEHVRMICHLNHVPAVTLAQTVGQLLRSEGNLIRDPQSGFRVTPDRSVVLVPESVGNCLLLAGPPDAVQEVRRLIEELDQPPAMLVLEVVLGEAPVVQAKPALASDQTGRKPTEPAGSLNAIEQPPRMETIGRGRLVTMDNQPAQIQIGTHVPLFAGAPAPSKTAPPGRISHESVGLTIAFTPRVLPGAVVMEIDVKQSQLGPESESVPIGFAGNQLIQAAKIDTTLAQTTVRIADGQAMVLGSIARAGKPDRELLIVVTPHIIKAGGTRP